MVDQLGIHNEENNVSYILYYTQKYFHMDYRSKCDRQKNTRLEENLGEYIHGHWGRHDCLNNTWKLLKY